MAVRVDEEVIIKSVGSRHEWKADLVGRKAIVVDTRQTGSGEQVLQLDFRDDLGLVWCGGECVEVTVAEGDAA